MPMVRAPQKRLDHMLSRLQGAAEAAHEGIELQARVDQT
jgi:hypothetical protein